MQTYLNLQLEHLLGSALKFLSLPIIFADALLTDYRLEWLKLDQALAAGTAHGTEALLPFLKWAALLVLGTIAGIFIVLATVWSVLFHGEKKTPGGIIGDLLLLAMVLFLYYFIFASVVYFFFYIVLPVH